MPTLSFFFFSRKCSVHNDVYYSNFAKDHASVNSIKKYFERIYEPRHDKTNKMSVRPANSDHPGYPPSLIRDFAVRSVDS